MVLAFYCVTSYQTSRTSKGYRNLTNCFGVYKLSEIRNVIDKMKLHSLWYSLYSSVIPGHRHNFTPMNDVEIKKNYPRAMSLIFIWKQVFEAAYKVTLFFNEVLIKIVLFFSRLIMLIVACYCKRTHTTSLTHTHTHRLTHTQIFTTARFSLRRPSDNFS